MPLRSVRTRRRLQGAAKCPRDLLVFEETLTKIGVLTLGRSGSINLQLMPTPEAGAGPPGGRARLQISACSAPGKMVRLRDLGSEQVLKSAFVAMVPEPSPSNLPSGGHVLPDSVSDLAGSTTSRRLGRFALISALLAVGIWIIWDFLPALLWAVVVAIAIWPLFERSRLRRWNKTAAAAEATLLIGVVVIVPLIVLGIEIGREAVATVQGIREAERLGIPSPEWLGRLPLIGSYISDWWQSNLSEPQTAANFLGRIDRNWLIEWTRILGFQLIHRLTILVFTFLTLFFRSGTATPWCGRRRWSSIAFSGRPEPGSGPRCSRRCAPR